MLALLATPIADAKQGGEDNDADEGSWK